LSKSKVYMTNLIFDFDGTLIDSKQRLYLLFQYLVPKSNLSFYDYWDLKQNRITHSQILKDKFQYTQNQINQFLNHWMKEVEAKPWLDYDRPITGVIDYLKKMKTSSNLYLVTARQFDSVVLSQLENLGFTNLFTDILVTGQKVEKYILIQDKIGVSKTDWLIGDTGKDIEVGKRLGIRTAAVLTGFLNRNSLLEYNPDLIIDSVIEFNCDCLNLSNGKF
jgi:phosphoglycolate phosphatase